MTSLRTTALGLALACSSMACREYTPVASEIRKDVAPSQKSPTSPAPTISASTQTSAPPAPPSLD